METAEKDALRRNESALLAALRQAGAEIRNAKAFKCPIHGGKDDSAGIYWDDAGVVRFKCHSAKCGFGGDYFDVVARLENKTPADVLKASGTAPRQVFSRPAAEIVPTNGKPTARVFATLAECEAGLTGRTNTYKYSNPDTGHLDMVVFRLETPKGKTFRQGHQTPAGIVMQAPEKPWPIYNRGNLARTTGPVVVVEGEKCVHALHAIGITATTSPAGAGKAAYANWASLAGRDVYLWPDNDGVGVEHMKAVAAELEKLNPAPALYWLDPAALQLPEKGDAVDYLAKLPKSATAAERKLIIEAELEMARPMGAAEEMRQRIEDIIAGKFGVVPLPWNYTSRATRALYPGAITVLCGPPGNGKSFYMLQLFLMLFKAGVKVALYMLEEDRLYHMFRALAMETGDSRLADDVWVKANPDTARQILRDNASFVQAFGRVIYDAPDRMVTQDELQAWLKQRANEGVRVAGIDPVTAAQASRDPWIADTNFVMGAKATLRGVGASLVVVTHPRKATKGSSSMDDLAGGAAYQRFTHTIVWLEYHEVPREVMVSRPRPIVEDKATINRTAKLKKTRNSWGNGHGIGYWWDSNTFRFEEHGVITGDMESEDPQPTPMAVERHMER